MTVLPKRVIHLSSCKYLTKQGVRISLLSFQPKDISLGQNGLGGYDINVRQIKIMDFDRITTENWTIAFPCDWIEKSEEDGALYFSSPDGEKGFYLSLWVMSDEEKRTPEELISTFQKTEIESFITNNEGWKLLKSEINSSELPVGGYWEGFSESNLYRISGKQLASGKLVLRATFHDYYCENQELSKEYFAPIIDSLRLY